MKLGLVLASAGAASLLALSGCSTSTEEAASNTQNDNAAACQALNDMRTQVVEVTASGASQAASGETVTVDQAKEGLATIESSYDEVKKTANNLSSSVSEQFTQAEDAYKKQLETISDDQSLASANAEVKAAQRTLFASYEKIVSELGC
jgi:hypothetical protein